ncbi:MAG: hypothetical protein HY744_23395 [Deltaproteobacteria bacterium]|nr:hypothetical protein [Deltaproteobacteria bacterium]
MALSPGTRVDRYVLVRQLGEGGQAAVWLAKDPVSADELCALKLLELGLARESDAERARREARTLARLSHPSLVKCRGLFEDLDHGLLVEAAAVAAVFLVAVLLGIRLMLGGATKSNAPAAPSSAPSGQASALPRLTVPRH